MFVIRVHYSWIGMTEHVPCHHNNILVSIYSISCARDTPSTAV